MDPKFTPQSSEPNPQFTQHSMQTLSHLDILCVYYPSEEITPSTLPTTIIFKIGVEASRSAISKFQMPDAMYVHKSYLPSFPEFFSVSHQHQLNPFSTLFEIILHPGFVARDDFFTQVRNSACLAVLDPRGSAFKQYKSESDIPYLVIPDPRVVTPKKQYNLNLDFPWNIQTVKSPLSRVSASISNIVGTRYHFACYAQQQWKQFKLKKKLERTYICAACRAKLSAQNYQMHLGSHPKKDGKQLTEQIKKDRHATNPSVESIGSSFN